MSRTVFADQAAAYAPRRPAGRGGTRPRRPRPDRLARLPDKVAHCRTRSAVRLGRRSRVPASLGELLSLRYRRFSLGWKSFAQDLFL